MYIVLEKHILHITNYGMSIATTTTAPALECPGAPRKPPKSGSNGQTEGQIRQPDFGKDVTPSTPTRSQGSPVCPGAPTKASNIPDDSVPSIGEDGLPTHTGHPQLSPSMRSDMTPEQSPTGSPMCPGAPRAPIHHASRIPQAWGDALEMKGP